MISVMMRLDLRTIVPSKSALINRASEMTETMRLWLQSLPPPADFFPPSHGAWRMVFNVFRSFPLGYLLQWTPLAEWQMMGKTSGNSKFNLPGRYAWVAAEIVGPINLLYILYTLPKTHAVQPHSSTSFIGTGLPVQHEALGVLYVLHYINRAVVTPLFLTPSMSPIHPLISALMVIFQFVNSSNIACWIVYSARDGKGVLESLTDPLALAGTALFFLGLAGNIHSENKLFSLRRGAAKRKAKSEGKAVVTYDKVYSIPPAEGVYKHVLYPHYVFEWIEWTGYWILGGALGLGWGNQSAALWFVINELLSMLPRAVSGKQWYEKKFGKRAIAGRAGAIPFLSL